MWNNIRSAIFRRGGGLHIGLYDMSMLFLWGEDISKEREREGRKTGREGGRFQDVSGFIFIWSFFFPLPLSLTVEGGGLPPVKHSSRQPAPSVGFTSNSCITCSGKGPRFSE